MKLLRYWIVALGCIDLLLLGSLLFIPIDGTALVVSFGTGRELALNVWRPTPDVIATLWYVTATTSTKIVGIRVPLWLLIVGFGGLLLAVVWWPDKAHHQINPLEGQPSVRKPSA